MELYYEEKGKGTPLVLLHGNGENHEYFRHQIDCFSEDFRVIAPDTRTDFLREETASFR